MHRLLHLLFLPLLCLFLFSGYFQHLTALTQDLGRHLKTGEIILSQGFVPKVNLFSYTYPGFPFINHHWLAEVIYYLLHQIGGYTLLYTTALTTIISACAIIFYYAYKRFLFPAVILVSCLYLPILFERTDLRPELFSFLFMAIFLVTLFVFRERFTRFIYLLPAVELIWVNTHIYFFVGIILLGLFLLDEGIRKRQQLTNHHTRTLLIVTIISCFTILINPNGLQGALYPLRVFDNYGYTIEENQTFALLESLGFQKPSIPYFKLGVLILFGSLFASLTKTRLIDWLLSITFTIIGFMAVRNFPLFVFATFIPCCLGISHALTFLATKLKPYPKKTAFAVSIIGYTCLLLFLLFNTQKQLASGSFGYQVADEAGQGVNFLLQNNIKGPIFNNFDIGSYLIYRLYPNERVFIDGRPEAYPASFLQNTYIPMQQNIEFFNEVDKTYRFNTIFLSHADQTPWAQSFLQQITKHPNWKPVYLDDYVIILLKDTEQNRKLLKQYGKSLESLQIRHFDPKDYQSLLRLANFFNLTEKTEKELEMYQHILTLKPDFCPALRNTAILLTQKNDPTAPIFIQRYQVNCE